MVSCFRIFWVLVPVLLGIATVILGAFSIAGSTKAASPVDQIYLLRLNLTGINLSNAITQASDATGTDLSSLNEINISEALSELGLSEIYSFGLWSYCKGSNDNGNYEVEHCSDPEPMYAFNPIDVLNSELNGYDIVLPQDVQDYISSAKTVSKLIFITAIIAVCMSALMLLFTLFSFGSKCVSCVAFICSIITVIAILLASASSTGTFLIISRYFNDSTEEYGIDAGLGNYYYYGLIWGAAAAAIFALFFNLFAMCCGRTKSRKSEYNEEAVPMMVYQEKPY